MITEWKPADISRIDMAFPAQVAHLMPAYDEIPKEFKQWHGNKWADLVAAWFFSGIEITEKRPKDGIEADKALRHVGTILRSFEPKHEHKEAACAYLLSLWFDDIQYKPRKVAL